MTEDIFQLIPQIENVGKQSLKIIYDGIKTMYDYAITHKLTDYWHDFACVDGDYHFYLYEKGMVVVDNCHYLNIYYIKIESDRYVIIPVSNDGSDIFEPNEYIDNKLPKIEDVVNDNHIFIDDNKCILYVPKDLYIDTYRIMKNIQKINLFVFVITAIVESIEENDNDNE